MTSWRSVASLLLVTVIMCVDATPLIPLIGVPSDVDESLQGGGCLRYGTFVEHSVMTYAISYISDNLKRAGSADNGTIMRISDFHPRTPARFFEVVYQGEASSINFKQTLLDFEYAASGDIVNPVWNDRTQLRKNVVKYAKAASYKIARRTFGELLLLVTSDFVSGEAPEWYRHRCVPREALDPADVAISVEMAKLRNEIGEIDFGSFLDLTTGTTLAFAIDDTGSMSGEIDAAKRRAEVITTQLENSINRPHEYVLVPFNDPFVYDVTHTRDSEEFKNALRRLYAHGGGDLPEMCLTGIRVALEKSRPGSKIYVITDDIAKDWEMQNLVIAEALHKKISIIFLLTDPLDGWCRFDSLASARGLLACRELYDYIADVTGGKVLVVGKHQIFQATEVVKTSLVQGLVDVMKTSIQISGGQDREWTLEFPVDPTVKELVIEASGTDGGCGSSVGYVDSLGNFVEMDSYGASSSRTFSSSVIVDDDKKGTWKIKGVNSDVNCEGKVSARTSFGFIVTTFVKEKSQQNKDYKILNGLPTSEESIAFYIDFYGNDILKSARGDRINGIRFVDDSGDDVIRPHRMSSDNQLGESTERIHFPDGLSPKLRPFYIVVEGTVDGIDFKRFSSKQFSVSPMEITTNIEEVVFRPGMKNEFVCSVTNTGTEDIEVSFDVSAREGKIQYDELRRPSVAPGKTDQMRISITLDDDIKRGTAVTITITTKDSFSDLSQYHVIEPVVGKNERPKVESIQIDTIIQSRFAETKITVEVYNEKDVARDAKMEIMLPGDAFIMNMTMQTENEIIVGTVEEKERAKKIYDKAKEKNFAAAHVAVRDKSSQVHRSNMLVPPKQSATFVLTYQELLTRQHGRYEYMVYIEPHQPVKHMRVDIQIQEESPLAFVEVPGYQSKRTYKRTSTKNHNNPGPSSTISFSKNRRKCHVAYHPSLDVQTAHSPLGLSGSFAVQYDVQRDQAFGESIVSEGYFTHFFSPPPYILAPPKMVIFMVDTSASMFGHKMKQAKEALRETMKGLNSQDYVNLVMLNDEPRPVFDDVIIQATPSNVDKALKMIDSLEANGGTDYGKAFDVVLEDIMPIVVSGDSYDSMFPEDEMMRYDLPPGVMADFYMPEPNTPGLYDKHTKMLMLLTDGKPTSGNTDTESLLSAIEEMNKLSNLTIHTVGFGTLADMDFLDKLALQNGGESKRIFEDIDAAAQITTFFDDVMKPLMSDVRIEFEADKVSNVTVHKFDRIYEGQEVVVSGKFIDSLDLTDSKVVRTKVSGKTIDDFVEIEFSIDPSKTPEYLSLPTHKLELFSENMWAFKQIKDLLDQKALATDPEVKQEIKKRALELSLEHNFVTPLTSMIVLDDEDLEEIEDELEEEEAEKEEDDEFARTTSLPEVVPTYAPPSWLTDEEETDTSYGGVSDGGWFYGDPHFMIPINEQINLCFTWNGKTHETYNILYDRKRAIGVNALMTRTEHVGDDGQPRSGTFVTAISFVLKQKNFVIIVHPTNVTVEHLDSTGKNFTFPVLFPFSWKIGSGVVINIRDVIVATARVQIVIDGNTHFEVVLRRDRQQIQTHLDFSIGKDVADMKDEKYTGLIGEFVHIPLKILDDKVNKKTQVLHVKLRGKEAELLRKTGRNPMRSGLEELPCWMIKESDMAHRRYLVDDLFSIPDHIAKV